MYKTKIFKYIVIGVLIVSFFSLFLYKTPYVKAIDLKHPTPGKSSIHCGHRITDLALSYKERVKLISDFENNRFFKEAIDGKKLEFTPYARKVRVDDGRVYSEICYIIDTNNPKKIQLIIGVKQEEPIRKDFTVQLSTAIMNGTTWKSWKETDYVLNNSAKIESIFNNGKLEIKDYRISGKEYTPQSFWKCLACEGGCEAGCEGTCFIVSGGLAEPACMLPCIALCHQMCSGPCGG